MQHLKEESSFLPDYVAPQKNEQKRIIKKVRFHDDESEQVQDHAIIEDDEEDHDYQQSSDDDKEEDEFDVAKVGQKRHRLTRSRMTRQGARTLTKLINQEDAESDSMNPNIMAAATTESQTSQATVPTTSTSQIVGNTHKRPKHSDDASKRRAPSCPIMSLLRRMSRRGSSRRSGSTMMRANRFRTTQLLRTMRKITITNRAVTTTRRKMSLMQQRSDKRDTVLPAQG